MTKEDVLVQELFDLLREISSEYLEIVETDSIPPSIKGNFYPSSHGEILSYHTYITYVPIGTIFEEYTGK